MKRYSKKGLEKRKEERKDYPEFYQKHIQIIRDNNLCCQECGDRLKGNSSEVCHIIPKSTFKSVSTCDDNILYLCGMHSDNNCHSIFDGGNEGLQKMKVFEIAQEKIKQLTEIITEKINYKFYDKWLL